MRSSLFLLVVDHHTNICRGCCAFVALNYLFCVLLIGNILLDKVSLVGLVELERTLFLLVDK
jgi:hypothetical protein